MLLARSDLFARTFTEKLLTYALGRGVKYHDMPSCGRSCRREQRDGRFSAFVLGIVNSAPFQMRAAKPRRQRTGATATYLSAFMED